MTTTLAQKLESRHLNMIALGGSIGTGIFLASGYSISVGGPGGAMLAYVLMALIVYFLMTSLGEMSVYRPSSGTFCDYSSLYVGQSFGFAMGYNYWINWAITIAAEIAAASLIMSYWFPEINGFIFSAIFFFLILFFNVFSVRIYGEVEYLLSFIKVAVIMVFIVLGGFAIFHQPHFGAQHWFIGDAPFHNSYYGFITVFLFAGFSFQGTELIGVASGETKNPEVNIPKSIRLVFWRLTIFYVISIAVISLLIPYTDHRLTYQDNVSMSPYTLIFSQYASHYAADIINFVILVAVLSAANASMYSSTRILWYLSRKEQAPKIFSRITKHGVPFLALLATAFIGSIVFVSSRVGNGALFSYLVQISSLCGFLAWFGIALSHYRFRKDYLPQAGGVQSLSYTAKFYPYAQIVSMLVIGFVIIAQVIPVINMANYHLRDLVITYSSVILFFILYIGHKYYIMVKKL
jgi:lysine-specific permease